MAREEVQSQSLSEGFGTADQVVQTPSRILELRIQLRAKLEALIEDLVHGRILREEAVDEFEKFLLVAAEVQRLNRTNLSKSPASNQNQKKPGLFDKITSRLRDFIGHRAISLTSDAQPQFRESPTQKSKIALAHEVRGKYAFVRTSSETFAANKLEQIALEDRPR